VEPRSSEGRQQGTAGRVAYVRPVAGVSPAPLVVPSTSALAGAAGFLNFSQVRERAAGSRCRHNRVNCHACRLRQGEILENFE
jgi:hypothetical protein